VSARVPPTFAPPPEVCPNRTLWKPSCKRRSCSFCGPKWARDWQRVLAINLDAAGVKVATIAITGPGADVLPWACEKNHKHSGTKGCRVQERPLSVWCETLPYAWQLMRQAARVATKRELGYAPPWLMCRVWEPQKRGVPHLHLVVPYGSFAERKAANVFRRHLARLSREYGFGRVQGELQPIEGREAARYLASYLAGRTAKKNSIRDNIADPNLPRSLLWLTPKLTRETLVTMRTVRRARHLWAAWDGICPVPHWASLTEAVRVAIVFRSIYPKRAGPPVFVDEALRWAAAVDASPKVPPDLWRYDDVLGMVPNEDHDRELTRLALVATHDPDWRREDAAVVA
jgi:hypothetical protein